ncbi:unnamed protein product [Sphagnum compactum]
MTRNQCHMIMDEVNNFLKKQVSCRDASLVEGFQVENINDVENMGNEELHSEMVYIFEDGVEGSIGEFGSNSLNEEGSEENIVEGDEEVGGEESFEQNKEDYNQRNAHENDDTMHGHVFDDRLREDHVRLCIFYCPMIVSTVVTICKWPSAQTILDGYPFIKHLIAFRDTHISNVDDVV